MYFEKEFSLTVMADSADAANKAIEELKNWDIEEMSGAVNWFWAIHDAAPEPYAYKADTVIADGKFFHPDEAPPEKP